MLNRREFALRVVFVGLVTVSALRLGLARDGIPGGPSRSSIRVAGTLHGVSGPTLVTFRFRTGMTVRCAPQVSITPGEGGAFSVEVPLDQEGEGRRCPDALFDGAEVRVDVDVGTTTDVVRDATVNPVPLAQFADRSGEYGGPDHPSNGWRRVGPERYIFNRFYRDAIPPCTGGVISLPIELDPRLGSSRDRVVSGTLSVATRFIGQLPFQPTYVHALVHGLTYSVFGWDLACIRGTCGSAGLRVTRTDDFSNRVYMQIPCSANAMRIRVHLDLWSSGPLD